MTGFSKNSYHPKNCGNSLSACVCADFIYYDNLIMKESHLHRGHHKAVKQ
jgi:hypothetical protein